MTVVPFRIPPHNLDAERALLGGALLERVTADLVASTPAEAFYTDAHRSVARSITRLVRAGQPVDSLTLIEDLRRAGDLETAGGFAAIALLEEHASIRAHASAYLGMVRECAARRELIQTASS